MKLIVLSDVHGNYAALKAVLDHININYGPAIHQYVFAGDAVGQGPHPNEVCTLLRTIKGLDCVRGDDEEAILSGAINVIDDRTASLDWTASTLTEENRKFLSTFRKYVAYAIGHMRILVVHGSPDKLLDGELTSDLTAEDLEHIFTKTQADIVITAHTHVPFALSYGTKLLLNAGSVGQPRDKDSRACYIFVDTDTRAVEFQRIAYPINITADAIARAGLPTSLGERLYYGW